MNHLRRQLAPVPEAAWSQIDDEATRSLRLYLGARRLVDVAGPIGWQADAVTTGTVAPEVKGPDGVTTAPRLPLPLVELRAPFSMGQQDLDSADRGNPAIDTNPVIEAARRVALAEDHAVFHGLGTAAGIVDSSPHAPIALSADPAQYPQQVAAALAVLRAAGVGGPYAVALGDQAYVGATETTEDGGYPVVEHLKALSGGDVVWVPALDGAVVLSARGGDFELTLGEDFSVGFRGADTEQVHLYLEESIAFRVLTPEAAVHLTPA